LVSHVIQDQKEHDIMTKQAFKSFVAIVAVVCLVHGTALGEEPGGKKPKSGNGQVAKVGQTKLAGVFNINNLVSWFRANGQGQYGTAAIQGDGSAYPRGTSHPFFADGLVWGAKAYLDPAHTQPAPIQVIRVGGGTYNVGNREGWIIGTGASANFVDPNNSRVRIYKIRRDWLSLTATQDRSELRQDAAENLWTTPNLVTDADMQAVMDQYARDWNEWPVDLGAPYVERNGIPGYQPPPAFGPNFTLDSLISGRYDEPGLAGADPDLPADQVMWTVFHDLDAGAMIPFQGSESMGIEGQLTIWGYKREDALGQLFFKRYRLINKGGAYVNAARTEKGYLYMDSMYVAQWADPDLGEAGDDLVGCDRSLSLGYVYNANAVDREYTKFSLPPPAAGYDFLQGPAQVSPNDSVVHDLKEYRHGYAALPMTSFSWFAAGSSISDPPFSYEGALRWWKMLRGFVPDPSTQVDRFYPNPPNEAPGRFPLSGDPVARTGSIDGLGQPWSFPPGDRRLVLSSGPFTLSANDTQDIVVGCVAGLGADRLSSITVMKFNDRFVQNTYNGLFRVTPPPPVPAVKVVELDGRVILEWGSEFSNESRVYQPGNYAFEGYNIYQLPSATAELKEGVRIATYDVINDLTVVFDEQLDRSTFQVYSIPVQYGTNSGIQRSLELTRDYVRDIDKLANGQEYYIAVTAYTVGDPEAIPRALESTKRTLTVRPKRPFGVTYGAKYGEVLSVNHDAGVSDGVISPIVVNPSALTGHTYEIHFADAGDGNSTWSLVDVTANQTVLSGQANQSGDGSYETVDGIFLKVEGPPPGMKDWDVPHGTRRITFADADGLGFEGFEGAIGWSDPNHVFNGAPRAVSASDLKNTLLRWGQVPTPTVIPATNGFNSYADWDRDNIGDANFSYAYRYLRTNTATPARPEFLPYIGNTSTGNYGFQDYKKSMPLSAWNIEADPPARLAVGFLENNVAGGLVDGRYFPPSNGNGQTNTESGGPREWLFIFNSPYTDATPNPALTGSILSNPYPVMWFCTINRRADNKWNEASGSNEFLILANHVNTPSDVFSFKAPAPISSAEMQKASAEKVGVFPNPYYAFNPAEINRFVRFVTFNNLPPRAKIRIFNLAGQLVRTLDKDDPSQFLRWDLNNKDNFPVASGLYIAHVEMTLPADNSTVTKILKIAIIQEQEVPDTYGERTFN
jgi:hypothetical protein